ncbi:UDP-N-acetylglucosamine 1-carboxyvinyltransferase [Nonomuraea cavernae]|uniref:UDP-N-acetylglucosamine 1-carboxyvinyltransferase n=1 Tax=Nonomuraea cavernae TaxID=2045107 RepID=A0A917YSJ1_9ACTN|nr:UDP-N-acetylglucosamine 1-carboxyvinyltransferase [Nonomuraea cavernae]MCA2184618.1 hypothetical protein [Nonomuraea cavernae]GGO63249.1 UDP-N-acetylglucosamine 1-carboxyvinyltransferase [Nonomuraea cavernae]
MIQQTSTGVDLPRGLAVRGGRPLRGTVAVDGSKNAALPLVAAAAAIGRPVTLTNVPMSSDVGKLVRLIHATGARVVLDGHKALHVIPDLDHAAEADRALAASIRASYYLAPALLASGRAELPWPGGCNVGDRGMELHFMVYEAFGDRVHTCEAGYQITASPLQRRTPVEIKLPFPSRGTTVVALLRAVVAGRPLLLHRPNTSPEVAGLVKALAQAGHEVSYLPDDVLSFQPGNGCPATWCVPGDKIEAGTLLCALAATGGHGRVSGVNPTHMSPLLDLLDDLGFPITITNDGVELSAPPTLTGTSIYADASLNSLSSPECLDADFEPPLIALALTLAGRSHTFIDEINPGRHANLLPQLRRLGAVITEVSSTSCELNGPQRLAGASVEAIDIRTGSALLIAALTAAGTTELAGLTQLQRGHADLPGKLHALGADIITLV